MAQPIRRSVLVEAPAADTFAVFTGRLADWWPVHTYALGAGRVVDVVCEQRLDGRVFEMWDDGTERTWGRFLAWEPPRRFAMTWEILDGPPFTEVDVRFRELGPRLTRVELSHHGWERVDPAIVAQHGAFASGWRDILTALADFTGGKVED